MKWFNVQAFVAIISFARNGYAQDIMQALRGEANADSMVSAIEMAELVDFLEGDGPYSKY